MRKILLLSMAALLLIIASCSVPMQIANKDNSSGIKDYGSELLKATKLVPNPTDIKKIACGGSHSFILLYNGDLYATGSTTQGVLGLSKLMNYEEIHEWIKVTTDVKDVATNYNHSLIIKTDGNVYATGSNYCGKLGIDIDDYDEIYNWKKITDEGDYISVACGTSHSMSLRKNGCLYFAGKNEHGEFGLGTDGNYYEHFAFSRFNVKKIVSGCNFNLIIDKNNKQVYATGSNSYGQLGLGEDDASTEILLWTQVTTGGDIIDIACGSSHSLLLKENGEVYGCGKNFSYQLGLSENINRRDWTYLNINGARSINAGYNTSLVIKTTNNRLYSTGDLFNTWTYILWDTKITGCGDISILGVKNNNNFYGLGRNDNGQLGLGEINYFNEFERIEDYLEE